MHQRLTNQLKGVAAALLAMAVLCACDQALMAGSLQSMSGGGAGTVDSRIPAPAGAGMLLTDNGAGAYVEFGPIALNNVLIGAGAGTPTGGLIQDANVTPNALTVSSMAASLTNRLDAIPSAVGVISADGGVGAGRVALAQGALGAVFVSGGAGANPVFTAQGAAGAIFISQGVAANPVATLLSGDLTMSSAGVTAIGANKVTLGQMATLTARSVIANATNAAATPTAVQATANQIFAGGSAGTTLGFVTPGGDMAFNGTTGAFTAQSTITISSGANAKTGDQPYGNHSPTGVQSVVMQGQSGVPANFGNGAYSYDSTKNIEIMSFPVGTGNPVLSVLQSGADGTTLSAPSGVNFSDNFTLPAGSINVIGRHVRFEMRGRYTTGAVAGSITLTTNLDATQLANGYNTTYGTNKTNLAWWYVLDFVTRTVGASATVTEQARTGIDNGGSITETVFQAATTVNVGDLTASRVLQVNATAPGAGNAMTVTDASVTIWR